MLNGVNIVEQAENGQFLSLVRARSAIWSGEFWVLDNPVIYQWEDGLLRVRSLPPVDTYREQPDTFRRSAVKVEELPAREAGLLVADLKAAGLPFIEALTDYHHRFSFPTVSFVIMILSISMGSRFRKNILLMSLLSSLSAAVLFYVMEMISMMMAKLGYIPPVIGAWFPVGIFIVIGFIMLGQART
jgi:lipopolysaccharide export system permease protein